MTYAGYSLDVIGGIIILTFASLRLKTIRSFRRYAALITDISITPPIQFGPLLFSICGFDRFVSRNENIHLQRHADDNAIEMVGGCIGCDYDVTAAHGPKVALHFDLEPNEERQNIDYNILASLIDTSWVKMLMRPIKCYHITAINQTRTVEGAMRETSEGVIYMTQEHLVIISYRFMAWNNDHLLNARHLTMFMARNMRRQFLSNEHTRATNSPIQNQCKCPC